MVFQRKMQLCEKKSFWKKEIALYENSIVTWRKGRINWISYMQKTAFVHKYRNRYTMEYEQCIKLNVIFPQDIVMFIDLYKTCKWL